MAQVIRIEDNNKLASTSLFKHASWDFDKFNPVQTRLLETYDGDSNIAIAAATSAGKAQPLSSKVLSLKGFVKMGSLSVGDRIVSSNGSTQLVTGVFPQGKKKVFEVVFSDGSKTRCCKEHLWSVRTRFGKHQGRPYKTVPLESLIGDIKTSDGQNKWFIPVITPSLMSLNRDCAQLPLHPYLLGVILGDGGIKHRVIFSNEDNYVLKRVEDLLPNGATMEQIAECDHQITGGIWEEGKSHGFMKTNLIKRILEDLELFGCGSCEKFIPQIYLNADPLSRLELLRGLMDTDGTANGTKAAEFTSCSEKLAQGVRDLARSFGAVTKVRQGKSSYRNNEGDIVECQDRFRVTVNMGEISPFDMPSKVVQQNLGLERGRVRSVESIKEDGIEECQCISVSSSDKLYITDDYILTHNTVCAEMYMSYEVRDRGGKAAYIGPLKALASEKQQDWTDDNHHFNDLDISIITGDFRLTPQRVKELDNSDIVVMTPEMLASRCRSHKSEKSSFLKEIGTIVFDESHLLTVPGRGDHIEVALMKLVEINPDVRIVLLSATMPNVDEICGWVSNLTGRDTFFLESDYRPCPLNVHYEMYYDGDRSYDAKEMNKVATATMVVEYYENDKFLIFVHTKRTGQLMVKYLQQNGIQSEFHNADLNFGQRKKLEDRFKNDPEFRVIVATSTLAWGLNLPARRVIVTGIHRGLTIVENYDIRQMIGRAGRPRYDPRGDAYILVPESHKDEAIETLQKDTLIRSTLLEYVGTDSEPHYKTLAFHIVSEIHQGAIKTPEGFREWFDRSLAHFQDVGFNQKVLDKTIQMLERCRAIKIDENGEYKTTTIGTVASMYYYSPFDVSDLNRNFYHLFNQNKQKDDFSLAMALGDVDSNRWAICNRKEKEEMGSFQGKINRMFGEYAHLPGSVKYGYAYYNMLNGKRNVPAFQALQTGIMFDLDRTMQVLYSLDSMANKGGHKDYLKTVRLRLQYGVGPELVQICQIPNVGQVRGERLRKAGIKNPQDLIKHSPDKLAAIMKCSKKLAEGARQGAEEIVLKESIN